MDSDPVTQTKKRTLGHMLATDLVGKLKSKQDFYVYFDKHRKCPIFLCLIAFQFSSTCPTSLR